MSAATGGGGGELLIVGLGPGDPQDLTPRARRALERAELVVGYQPYVEWVARWVPGRELHPFPIGQEAERAAFAVALARDGRRVALVSSGDAGVYAMAGLALEALHREDGDGRPGPRVEVVPGVTAALAAAARLGAPLGVDFACISLSDLHLTWERIAARLEAAAAADLVVALYNPRSRRRTTQLGAAQAIFLRHRPPETPVGIVSRAGRDGEAVTVTTLGQLLDHLVDMETTVIVGGSRTARYGEHLVTGRGQPARAAAPAGGEAPAPPPSPGARGWLQGPLAALGFLTVWPLPGRAGAAARTPAALAAAPLFFPLAGLVLGGVAAGCALLLGRVLPAPVPAVGGLVALAVGSGGMSWDGWMDTWDGIGGGRNPAARLAIMRDSRVGAFGVLGAVLLGLALLAVWSAVPAARQTPAWLCGPLVARGLLAGLLAIFPYARPAGAGTPFTGPARRRAGLGAVILTLGLAWGLGGVRGLGTAVAVAVLGGAAAAHLRSRLGGLTGDTLGALAALAELVVFAGFAWR